MFNMILFGPPGAGKGTQSRFISAHYGYVHLSTGQVLRDTIARDGASGQLIKKFIDRGYLVPDDIVLRELLRESLEHADAPGLIFDGFPRTVHQAEILDEMLTRKGMPLKLVVSLEVEKDELYRRIMGRSVDSGRSDDREEVIKQRFLTYETETLPLKSFYRQEGRLVEVSGMAPKQVVFERIRKHIDTRLEPMNRESSSYGIRE